MPKTKLTAEAINKLIELTNNCKNSIQIASELKVNKKTVQRWWRYLKLNRRYLNSLVKKKCLNCDVELIKKSNKFCSVSCSNVYRVPKDKKIINEQKKEITLKYFEYKGADRKRKIAEDNLLLENFDSILSNDRRRKRVIAEQKNNCNKCGISHWFEKPISLELEHIDGNNKNNDRSNLEALCPNCHSITLTWRGRNKTRRVIPLSIEQFKDAYMETKNVRQALLNLNVTAKGGNYKKMYQALDLYDIEYKKANDK